MGLFRYVLQGFGWEVGRHAAREGIDALEQHQRDEPRRRREAARLAKAEAKQEARERKRREAEAARQRADIERQLVTLKKRADR